MKLILRRDQRSAGMISSKMKFSLTMRAELTGAEQAAINKYKLGDTELYRSHDIPDIGSGLLAVVGRAAINAMIKVIKVDHLAKGRTIEAEDVVQLLAIEEQVKEAAHTFKAILDAAATFGGEEVIEIGDESA